jgi:hypothetical protein
MYSIHVFAALFSAVVYPLNEICIADDVNHLIQGMITVREKTG